MKHLLSILAVFIFLSLAKNSYCQEDRWVYICNNTSYNFFIDSTSIQPNRVNHYVDCWEKEIPINSDFENSKEIKSKIKKIRFYCSERKFKILELYIYFKDNSLDSYTTESKLYTVIPESVAEFLYDYVCK